MKEITESDKEESSKDEEVESLQSYNDIPLPSVRTYRESEAMTSRPLRESQATEQGMLLSERKLEEILEEKLGKLNSDLKQYRPTFSIIL